MTVRGWLRLAALLICCISCWLPASASGQPVTCSVTSQSAALNFGNVELGGSATATTSAPLLSYTCTNNGGGQSRYARLCINILNGSGGSTNSNPRAMMDASGNVLRFQLYQDPARSVVWGPTASGGFQAYEVSLSMAPKGSAGDTATGTISIYGGMSLNQPGVPPGTYTGVFSAADASATYATGNQAAPASCAGGTTAGSFPFTVSAAVVNTCVVTATPMDFGSADGLSTTGPVDAQSSISVTCPANTSYSVSLTPSNGSATGAGVMSSTGGVASNTDVLPYQLYRDAARATNVWGNVIGTNTVSGIGTGLTQAVTVYGRVPRVNVVADGYQDAVTVNVVY